MQTALRWAWFGIATCCCAVVPAGDDAAISNSRLQRAESEFRNGNYATAYRLASADARSSKQRGPQAQAAQLLAAICYRSGRLQEALQRGEQYLRLVDHPEVRDIASIQVNRQEVATLLAETNASLGRPSRAGAWFEYALRIPKGKRLPDPTWEAQVRLRWAKAIFDADADAPSLALYQETADAALALLRQIERREVAAKHRAAATEVLVQASLKSGRLPNAQQALETLLATQQEPRHRAVTLMRLADVCRLASNEPRETELLEQALGELPLDENRSRSRQAPLLERLAAAQERAAQHESAAADSLLEQARQGWQKAAACYEALAQSNHADDSASFEVISNLQRAQEIYVRQKRWTQALPVAERLLHARETALLADDPSIFRAKTVLGICYAQCERDTAAKEQLQPALRFWRDYRPTAFKELADTLQNLAEIARKDGEYDVAHGHLTELLQILETAGGDDVGLIECHITRGNVFSAQGEYDSAIKEYRAAEDATAERGASAASAPRPAGPRGDSQHKRLRSVALLGRAAVYKSQLRFDAAIDACERAFKAYAQGADQVPCLTTLAALHLARYEFDASRRAPRPEDVQSARVYLDQAEELSRDRDDLPIDQRGQLLHVLALINFRQAQSHFQTQGDNDRVAAGKSCAAAIDYWRQAATLGNGAPPRAVQVRSASYLAEAQLLAFDLSRDGPRDAQAQMLHEAYENCSKAIDLVEELHAFPGLHYRALLTRAKIVRLQAKQLPAAESADDAQAKIEQSIDDLKKAVRAVEAPRSNSLGADKERAMFFSQFVEAYELLISWLIERGDLDSAVAYSQISRNRTFIEQVTVSENDQRTELAKLGKSGLVDELHQQIERCDRLRREIQQAASQKLSDAARQKLQQKCIEPLTDAQAECDRLELAIRDASDSYRNLLRRGLTVDDWEAARKQVVGAGGLLLVYHVGPTASQLFVITPEGTVQCHNLELSETTANELSLRKGPVNSAAVGDLVNRYLWRRGLQRTRGESKPDLAQRAIGEPLSPAQAVRLTELVLPKEVRDLIARRKPAVVTVVPDGALNRLPLESLLLSVEPLTYVLDDETIPPFAYAPSAMVLVALQLRPVGAASGAPSLLTAGSREYVDRPPLPLAEDECHAWAQRFAKLKFETTELLGPAATERTVRNKIGGKKFVHFAVHGDVDTQFDSGFSASLALTPGEGTPDDDGVLNLQEVYALPLGGCELAVLSACQSNLGPNRNLEAGSTLTRAFLSAGARRVVASLWSVADDSTRLLMDEFANAIVESLAEGPHYAQALQRARRLVKQQKDFSDPFYWAPFVLIGPAN